MAETLDPAPVRTTQTLADWAVSTPATGLPEDVADYTKLLVLDSIACGLGAARMERTRLSHRVAERFGGPAEATLFGHDRRVPSAMAAAANAEIMNLLDADDTFFNTAHFVVLNVAAALSESERLGGPGAELVRAVAIGFDVSARFNLASQMMTFSEGRFRWSQLFGSGYASMGAAVSAGLVAGLDGPTLAHALDLVAGTAPGARNPDMSNRTKFGSYKYAPNFHLAHAALTAVLMAEVGYRGEPELVDLEPGFIEGQGFVARNMAAFTEELGERWWIRDSSIKYLPSCRYTHAPAHALSEYMAEHGLKPDQIESLVVRLNPAAYSMPVFRDPATGFGEHDHRTPFEAQFNIPYILALVAHGRTPGAGWFDEENLRDPRIWEFARRVTTAPDPSLAEEWDEQIDGGRGRPRRTRGSMTIKARGAEHVVEQDYAPGDPWSEETRATWDAVTRKLHSFCGGMLPAERLDALVRTVRDLDRVENVARELTPLLQLER